VRPVPGRGVFIGLGPEAGYLLSAWAHDDVTVRNTTLPLQHVEAAVAQPTARIFELQGHAKQDYTPWTLMLSGSVGYEIPLDNHVGLVEARYTHGLVDIAKADWVKRSTRGFELLLGCRW
jgi:hypothetical protein